MYRSKYSKEIAAVITLIAKSDLEILISKHLQRNWEIVALRQNPDISRIFVKLFSLYQLRKEYTDVKSIHEC
jgi:hypothetical protein